MLKNFILFLSTLLFFSANAQNIGDTITIQTFDYSSTTRDTMINFPNNSLTYEKIIMSYNMRCKDDVVNTSGSINHIGCGAWDSLMLKLHFPRLFDVRRLHLYSPRQ